MHDEIAMFEIIENDSRYPMDAYQFVREALAYASDNMELQLQEFERFSDGDGPVVERHFTGQQLCEAIRQYAVNQFGYLAKVVLRNWNIDSTSCFGDLVYNMIDAEMMKKSEKDRREHFDDVYDFDGVFETDLEINASAANL